MEEPVKLSQDPILVAHERTYKAFNVLLRWCMVATASSLLFLTLWFATTVGFFGALFVGVVVFTFGYFLLVRQEEREPLDLWSADH
jgi:hypothetical protein